MPQINGRSLQEVRRYDLFKLAVAVLLFIAWLFFTDRMPTGSAGTAADAEAPAAALVLPSRLRIESVGGRIHLQGSVPDEAIRNDYVAAARKALGRADRIDDGLSVVEAAGRPDWLSHVGPAITAIAGHDGVSAAIDSDRVVLEGSVADEAQRTGLADRVTAAFGAPFTVVNRLTIAAPAPAPTSATASAPAAAPGSAPSAAAPSAAAPPTAASPAPAASTASAASVPASPAAAGDAPASAPAASPATPVPAGTPAPASAGVSASGPAPALRIAPAPVSVFFEEGVTTVAPGDGDKLSPLAMHARDTGASLRVSGFHSKTGSATRNAEIARERAFAVRDALVGLGVAADRIILDKPQETLGEEDNRRARRVDVGIDG